MKSVLIGLVVFLASDATHAQQCNPAAVHYIVHDEKGAVLTKTELEKIRTNLPKMIDDADVYVADVSFTADNRTFYWSESVDAQKGTKIPALVFENARTCTLHLSQVRLRYHAQSMKLVFNIDIARSQDDRRPVVDSLKFQNGTFRLDLTNWSHAKDKLIPATHWQKVKKSRAKIS